MTTLANLVDNALRPALQGSLVIIDTRQPRHSADAGLSQAGARETSAPISPKILRLLLLVTRVAVALIKMDRWSCLAGLRSRPPCILFINPHTHSPRLISLISARLL